MTVYPRASSRLIPSRPSLSERASYRLAAGRGAVSGRREPRSARRSHAGALLARALRLSVGSPGPRQTHLALGGPSPRMSTRCGHFARLEPPCGCPSKGCRAVSRDPARPSTNLTRTCIFLRPSGARSRSGANRPRRPNGIGRWRNSRNSGPRWSSSVKVRFSEGGTTVLGERSMPGAQWFGAAVESWDPDGKPLIDDVGELVITQPMPSLPIFLWGDEDGLRLIDSY